MANATEEWNEEVFVKRYTALRDKVAKETAANKAASNKYKADKETFKGRIDDLNAKIGKLSGRLDAIQKNKAEKGGKVGSLYAEMEALKRAIGQKADKFDYTRKGYGTKGAADPRAELNEILKTIQSQNEKKHVTPKWGDCGFTVFSTTANVVKASATGVNVGFAAASISLTGVKVSIIATTLTHEAKKGTSTIGLEKALVAANKEVASAATEAEVTINEFELNPEMESASATRTEALKTLTGVKICP